MPAFEEYRFDDAEIINVTLEGADLLVIYQDWAEKPFILRFADVVGYHWFNPERRALSHATESTDAPLIAQACTSADEDEVGNFKLFSFISAWNELCVLRIIASGVSRESAEPKQDG